jgi:hypothetical protein
MTPAVPKLHGVGRPVAILVNGEPVDATMHGNALAFNFTVPASRTLAIETPADFPEGLVSIYCIFPDAADAI